MPKNHILTDRNNHLKRHEVLMNKIPPSHNHIAQLSAVSLPSLRDLAKYASTMPTEQESTSLATLASVSKAADQVRTYFRNAQLVLSELQSQDDVEFIYEGRQAAREVDESVETAGEVMSQLMNALETTKSRNEKDSTPTKLKNTYLPIVDKIEQAIREWNQILGAAKTVKHQIAVASEWKELHQTILTEVESEMENTFSIVFSIQERRHLLGITSIDVSQLENAMNTSPFRDHKKLPNITVADRDLNYRFLELKGRLKPLEASLSIIPDRIEAYERRASELFPSSINVLKAKHLKLDSQWLNLTSDVLGLEKELVEDRWTEVFRKAAKQAFDKLDHLENNIKLIQIEEQYEKPETVKIERYLTMNSKLVPTVTKIIALFDQAVNERLINNTELFAMQASLHQRWSTLSVLTIKYSSSSAPTLCVKSTNFRSSATKLISLQTGTLLTKNEHGKRHAKRNSIYVLPTEPLNIDMDNPHVPAQTQFQQQHRHTGSAVSQLQFSSSASTASSSSLIEEIIASDSYSPLSSPDNSPTLTTRHGRLRRTAQAAPSLEFSSLSERLASSKNETTKTEEKGAVSPIAEQEEISVHGSKPVNQPEPSASQAKSIFSPPARPVARVFSNKTYLSQTASSKAKKTETPDIIEESRTRRKSSLLPVPAGRPSSRVSRCSSRSSDSRPTSRSTNRTSASFTPLSPVPNSSLPVITSPPLTLGRSRPRLSMGRFEDLDGASPSRIPKPTRVVSAGTLPSRRVSSNTPQLGPPNMTISPFATTPRRGSGLVTPRGPATASQLPRRSMTPQHHAETSSGMLSVRKFRR